MMAGCLPVFLGPPYHTMTFHQEVDYKAIGLFYNVSEYNLWQTQVDFVIPCSPQRSPSLIAVTAFAPSRYVAISL